MIGYLVRLYQRIECFLSSASESWLYQKVSENPYCDSERLVIAQVRPNGHCRPARPKQSNLVQALVDFIQVPTPESALVEADTQGLDFPKNMAVSPLIKNPVAHSSRMPLCSQYHHHDRRNLELCYAHCGALGSRWRHDRLWCVFRYWSGSRCYFLNSGRLLLHCQ